MSLVMKNPGTSTSGFVPMMTVLAQVSGQMTARGGGAVPAQDDRLAAIAAAAAAVLRQTP